MDDKSTIKNNYTVAVLFRSQLDLVTEESERGIQANVNVGLAYQSCISADKPEAKEDILNSAAKYYLAALTLAKKLNQAVYVEQAINLLQAIGRNEVGEIVANSSSASSIIKSPNAN